MAYIWQRWLVDELRAEVDRLGLDVSVIPIEGWENRGRPASTGHFDPNGAHTKHHTGATSSDSNPIPTLRTLIVGRPDLPGPLAQVATAHHGDIYVIAAGRANHAGRIGKAGVVGMPLGADGNALAMGDEVDTNGTQLLPEAQIWSMAVVSRVVTGHFGRPVTWIHRHQDISGTGKWDIGNRTTQQLRDDAQAITQEDTMNADQERKLDRVLANQQKILNRLAPDGAIRTKLTTAIREARELAAAQVDDATKAQVRRLSRQLDELAAALEAPEAGEGDATPHP